MAKTCKEKMNQCIAANNNADSGLNAPAHAYAAVLGLCGGVLAECSQHPSAQTVAKPMFDNALRLLKTCTCANYTDSPDVAAFYKRARAAFQLGALNAMTWREGENAVKAAVAEFPAVFGLWRSGTDARALYRINAPSSFYSDSSGIQLVVQCQQKDGSWLDAFRGTPKEIKDRIRFAPKQ